VPVVALDARLLAAGTTALRAVLRDHWGTAVLLRIDDAPRALGRPAAEWLRRIPALTLGVGTAPPADAFDLVTADPTEADAWCRAFEQTPHAAQAAALLLRRPPRDTWTGLVHESLVYSLLQAGPEFAAWRERHEPVAATDDAPRVRVDRTATTTAIALARPARHNAVDTRMRDELLDALRDAELAGGPVVVRGDGPSFCSGGDLDEFGTFPDPVHSHEIRLARSLAWHFHGLSARMVVGVHGSCLGAGIELPAFAAHVVATRDARFGLPELGLGLVPGAGGTVSITRRVGRSRLLALLLADGTIPAATAREWGLVDEVVAPDGLDERLDEIAESLA
jgi:enoyl-CoA hydratase/carnithine racemase